MSRFLDWLATVRGLPVLIGVALVLLNFLVRCVAYFLVPATAEPGFLLFLFTNGNLLLHLGVIVGLLGVLSNRFTPVQALRWTVLAAVGLDLFQETRDVCYVLHGRSLGLFAFTP